MTNGLPACLLQESLLQPTYRTLVALRSRLQSSTVREYLGSIFVTSQSVAVFYIAPLCSPRPSAIIERPNLTRSAFRSWTESPRSNLIGREQASQRGDLAAADNSNGGSVLSPQPASDGLLV